MQLDKRFPVKLSAALLCLATVLYGARARAEGSDGYLIDSAGSPVRAFSGECWHTRSWQPGSRFADCEPAPVVEAPAPVVEQTPPPLAPVPVLRPEGKAALDELADRLAVTQYEKLTIVGHADRIGPAAYNQKLSERRASAMRDYLIAQGIHAGKISSAGVGSELRVSDASR